MLLLTGTIGFIAPEYVQTRTYTDKCDVYSFGMVLFQVILCINDFFTIIEKRDMLEERNGILEPNKRRLEDESDLFNEDESSDLFNEDESDLFNEDESVNLFNEDKSDLFHPTSFLERFPVDEMIDPILTRLISPECLAVFMNIMKRCLNSEEPNERPTMGEVEVELEHALALQEEAERVTSITFFPPINGALKLL